METPTSISSLNVHMMNAVVPKSSDRIFQHTVSLGSFRIKNPDKVLIIATPRTDRRNIDGIVEPGLNSVSITTGEVTNSTIQFCFRRNDYFESAAPGLIISILIAES